MPDGSLAPWGEANAAISQYVTHCCPVLRRLAVPNLVQKLLGVLLRHLFCQLNTGPFHPILQKPSLIVRYGRRRTCVANQIAQ